MKKIKKQSYKNSSPINSINLDSLDFIKPKKDINKTVSETITTKQSLKKDSYFSYLKKIQKRLPLRWRAFSKFSQNNIIGELSNLFSKTIARSTSLLLGSLFTFIGVTICAYYAKNLGFDFNYLIFIPLFVAGYFLGLLIDLLSKLLFRSR